MGEKNNTINMKDGVDIFEESNSPTKIFTFGSCVSRDIFNHTKEGEFEVTLNIQRMSFALLPLEGYPIRYEDLDMDYLDDFPWEVKMMIIELSKTGLSMIKDADADYVVMDLVEERFEFAEFEKDGKTYQCIKSGHFDNLYKKYLKDKVTKYRELSIEDYKDEEITNLFRKSISVLLDKFPIDKIILIETYFANRMIDDEGKITEYEDKVEVEKMNVRLHRVYKLMKQILDSFCKEGEASYTLLKAPEDNMGYANHKWGPFPVHYIDEFYENMGEKILKITKKL